MVGAGVAEPFGVNGAVVLTNAPRDLGKFRLNERAGTFRRKHHLPQRVRVNFFDHLPVETKSFGSR
ncbi:hypothetical protein D3C87_1319460 [compost metagenome]